ncbi:glyoxalase [Loktanella sp. IMCC34160]|uniref:VOC family protein n=1 Tax=Loktanella sp. IMCC34160 TaxID=2510646 RepID=UPI00101C885C|nr:VOC family protein [Loktanella sp. IMCC34160]RYG89706.1 glyoxalase [Loktanella sp. IMCC34160]
MPRPRIDAVAITARDMARSVAFYRCLGFDIPEVPADAQHIEAVPLPGEARLMIDSAALAEKLSGRPPAPATHSAFALLCESPTEVDSVAAAVAAAGFTVKTQPWDAFWGQRYATVVDPDGYEVDLFAPLGG